MNKSQLDKARRRALNIFDKWVEATGFVTPHSGYYCELVGIIEDAVHCGAQEATGDFKKLESEQA
jgi:hypothetical protein